MFIKENLIRGAEVWKKKQFKAITYFLFCVWEMKAKILYVYDFKSVRAE
jgi:hypothetical protein